MLRTPVYGFSKKQPIRAGGISAPPPQATRGCAARLSRLCRSLSRLRRLLVRTKPNNTASYTGYLSGNDITRQHLKEKTKALINTGLNHCRMWINYCHLDIASHLRLLRHTPPHPFHGHSLVDFKRNESLNK